MTIHSKWTTGGLAFYNTGTTSTEFIIPTPSHPFAFGEQGIGFDVYFYGATTGSYAIWDEGGDALTLLYSDLNIYGASGSECVSFASSDSLVDFSGWNITKNDPTYTTGVAGLQTLTTLSPRTQVLMPTSAADVALKIPATSESQGIEFFVWNCFSTGGGCENRSLVVMSTGMSDSSGTPLATLIKTNWGRFIADGQTWRTVIGTT